MDVAGDLWFVLIEFHGRLKHFENIVHRNEGSGNPNLLIIEEAVDNGESLSEKLRKLLEKCEEPMLRAAPANTRRLGYEAGRAFVKTMFGREGLLEEMERLMQDMRDWIDNWKKECEGIVKS